jgi:hypothetical protein
LEVPEALELAPAGETVPLAPDDAVIVKVEPEVPAWVILKTFPAMVELAVLEDELVLAATEYCTVPLPVPLPPEVMVTQEAPLLAVRGHDDWVVTFTLPVPPAALKLAPGEEMEYVHVPLLTSLEYVLSKPELSYAVAAK